MTTNDGAFNWDDAFLATGEHLWFMVKVVVTREMKTFLDSK